MTRFSAEQRVGCFRLVEHLGSGGFAEVWRARPEPGAAGELSPADQRGAARVLAALARPGGAVQAGRLLEAAAEALDLIETTAGAPHAVRTSHQALLTPLFAWLEEPAAAGELDLALKLPFHDGYIRQLRREEDLLRRISHPNLVEQYSLHAAHDPPYLAMELISGVGLRDALKTEPLPPMKKVLAVMDQLLTVLDHLHRRGTIHGDVKPENVLMERDGTLRLIDLGLARVSQHVMRDTYLSLSLASRVPLLGTLSYMAPEVRRGEDPTPAADLYAAGIVLYELLCGDVPSGMTPPSEAAAHRGLTSRFDVLLRWVLHPEPERRISSAAEMRERVLVALNPRERHAIGTGVRAQPKPRDGTRDFDAWALEQASPFVAGDWVGDFQLIEPLGRGGFGEVWRARIGPWARPGSPERDVALKLAIGPGGRAGLEREAEVGARLRHASVPAVLEAHLDHDPPFLAVDLVRGESLRVRLNEQGRMDVDEVVPLIRSLTLALAHCHQSGVVHCDLKPENLLVDPEAGTLHLLDFGLATTDAPSAPEVHLSDGLRTGEAGGGGTFEYLPPERRRGEPAGPPADVYSAGVILFEALTLELPRGLTRLRELCGAPRALEALCEAMLAPDPARRPTPAQVAQRLEVIRPSQRIFGARRRRERTRRLKKRARRWAAPSAAAALAALGGVGLALLLGRLARPSRLAPAAALVQRLRAARVDAPAPVVAEAARVERAALGGLGPDAAPRHVLAAELELAYVTGWAEVAQRAEEAATLAGWSLKALGEAPADRVGVAEAATALQRLRKLDDDLQEALRLHPLAPAAPQWETRRAEVAVRSARRAAALRAAAPDELAQAVAARDPARALAVVAAVEGLLPEDPLIDDLLTKLSRPLAAEDVRRRLGLATRLRGQGDLGGAWAVVARTRAAAPDPTDLAEPLAWVAAIGEGIDQRLRAYCEGDPERAHLLVLEARRHLPGDRELARDVAAREAGLAALGLAPAQAERRALLRLWTGGADPAQAAAFARTAARKHPRDGRLAALARLAQALAGGSVQVGLAARPEVGAWRRRRAERRAAAQALAEARRRWVEQALEAPGAAAPEGVLPEADALRAAWIAEERAALEARRASLASRP